jgi:hypothetical protein
MTSLQKNVIPLALAGLALCFGVAAPAKGQVPLKADPSQAPLNDASGKGTLTAYERFAQYPPDSRPLNTSNWDLIHPWSTDTSPAPMIPSRVAGQAESLRASGVPEDEAWRRVMPASLPQYQFELNKTIVAGTDDELRATLRVTAGPDSDTRVRFQVAKAELIGDQDFGSPHLGTVPFSCDPAESACTFRWKAPSADRQNWGILELQVTVTVDGMQDDFMVRQSFYSSPMVAGKFTGVFRERLDNGSLVIDAGVSVQKRMACFLSANLFSVDKEMPTHHVERRLIVDPSMKTVSFTFFGKIFRDFGHEGAFRLQDLKGQCENLAYPPEWFIDSEAHQAELLEFANNPPPTREPGRIYFAYNQVTYTTRRYPNNTFSDREWTSPERQRKLELLKKAAEDLNSPDLEQRKRQSQQQPQ